MHDIISHIYNDKTGSELSLAEVKARSPRWYEYMMQCAALLNVSGEESIKKMFWHDDPHRCWFWCYDDGFSPAAAVAEYKGSLTEGRTV